MAYQAVLLSLAVLVFVTHQIVKSEDKVVTDLTSASNLFSQNLYKHLTKSGQSIVYSPYSIHSALAMTSIGAREDTLQEMRKVLGLTNIPHADVGNGYKNLIAELNSVTKVNLSTSNTFFANPLYTIKDDFIKEIGDKFYATCNTIDWTDPDGPEAAINDYISVQTKHLITKVLSPGSITTDTVVVLINTIYFHGGWEDTFPKHLTKKDDFFHDLKSSKKVDMMHRTGSVMYKKDLNRKVEVMELPFQGNRFGLYIVLPNDIGDITDLEDTLTNGVDDLFQNMQFKSLKIAIPKFKIETTLKLKPTLEAMGMLRAFSRARANFTGISDLDGLHITKVIHKSVIDVMEKGTTATAATVVKVEFESVMLPTGSFRADHPFIYVLRDKQTGQIMFQGKFCG